MTEVQNQRRPTLLQVLSRNSVDMHGLKLPSSLPGFLYLLAAARELLGWSQSWAQAVSVDAAHASTTGADLQRPC